MSTNFPPYTADNYAKLAATIATGARKVTYGDKEVEYQNTEDMQALLTRMARALGYIKPNNGRTFGEFTNGML